MVEFVKKKLFATLLKIFLFGFSIIKILLRPERIFAKGVMRLFVSILSFVMLGLSCLPCSDMKLFAKNHASLSLENVKSHTDNQNICKDLCNPFCSCACCGTTQVNQKASAFDLQVPKELPSYSIMYSEPYLVSIAIPIWQPPQLFV